MPNKLLIVLFLLLSATPAFSRCGNYLVCSYEIFENERRMAFTAHPHLLDGIEYSVEDVNDNKFVVCVFDKDDDTTVFISHGCAETNYGRAKSLVEAERHAPYWDGESIKFRDGKGGRPLQKLYRHPKAFDWMELKRGLR